MEVLEVQEQLQRARDNLRHVEEGIKKTAISSNLRFGDNEGGRGRPGRRLMGRLGGVQRFREETDAGVDEPPLKKSLSSVASRLGPLNTENKPDNDNDDDAPTLKSTVTLSQIQDRESASSVVNDTKTLNRSKRLFGSLLMGTLRQFKQEKEKTKTAESKQAEMWDKINQKEAEQVALTAADRRRLESAKAEVNQEIRLLEEKMELAEMKVRAIEERDTYAEFIRTKTKPSLYYQPKEYSDVTKKALTESNLRVNKLYDARIEGYSNRISEIEQKLEKLGGGVEKQLGELSTVKIEKLTRTVSNDRSEKEEKVSHPETGIKVEVQLRSNNETEVVAHSDSEPEQTDEDQVAKMDTDNPAKKSRSRSVEKNRVTDKEKTDSKNKASPGRTRGSPRRNNRSPKRKSRSPRRKSRSPRKRSRSPKKKSRSPRRKSRSPRRKSRSPKRKSRSPRRKSRSRSPQKMARSTSKKATSPHRKSRSPKSKTSTARSPNTETKNDSPSKKSRSKSPRPQRNGAKSKSKSKERGENKTSASSKVGKNPKKSRSRSSSGSSSSSSGSSSDSD